MLYRELLMGSTVSMNAKAFSRAVVSVECPFGICIIENTKTTKRTKTTPLFSTLRTNNTSANEQVKLFCQETLTNTSFSQSRNFDQKTCYRLIPIQRSYYDSNSSRLLKTNFFWKNQATKILQALFFFHQFLH